jgi:adenylate cyclase
VADLIAQGAVAENRWKRPLPPNEPVVIGRSAGTWAVPWDALISRRHAELCWRNGRLSIRRLPTGRNPILLNNQETNSFELGPNESFVIGDTTFTLASAEASILQDVSKPVQEYTYSAQELRNVHLASGDHRLDVLGQLPGVIAGAASDRDLFTSLVNLLLTGIERASTIALVAGDPNKPDDGVIDILHWDRRQSSASGDFRPSERLIREALRRKQSVLHSWSADSSTAKVQEFTYCANIDWAYCTPIGAEQEGWAFYVAGHYSQGLLDPSELRSDLKFTELMASILLALRQLRSLQRQRSVLSQFLSPLVLGQIAEEDADAALAPRQTQVSVLFCDLRGFSRESEKSAADLMGLLERVSKALHVMTHSILDNGGVVGDFQGDAAMGFWGWPFPQPDSVSRACMAALAIRTRFEAASRRPGHHLANFRVGIGLATGQAVAGKIGTSDQAKVGVFGPVVNRASRLEGMTKILHGSILLDEDTAQLVRRQVPRSVARVRRLAQVKPYGLDTPIMVSELLPPLAEAPDLPDQQLTDYEAALDAFITGNWSEAIRLLHRLPPDDRVKDFLLVFIVQNNYSAPANWSGVIELTRKS